MIFFETDMYTKYPAQANINDQIFAWMFAKYIIFVFYDFIFENFLQNQPIENNAIKVSSTKLNSRENSKDIHTMN